MQAGIAQLVEYELPKLGVAGSRPVARSNSEKRVMLRRSRIGRRGVHGPHSFGGRLGFFSWVKWT